MADTSLLESQLNSLLQRREELQAELQRIASEFFSKVDQANALERAGDRGAEFQQLSAEIRQLRAQRVEVNRQLAQIEQQIAALQSQINAARVQDRVAADQGPPTASASVNANATVDPPGPLPDRTSTVNALPTALPTSGTNASIRTGTSVQAVEAVPIEQGTLKPAPQTVVSNEDAASRPGVPNGNQPGVFSNDDSERSSTRSTANKEALRQQIDNLYSANITTAGNTLSKYTDYTYQLSWYLLPKNGLEILSRSRTNTLPGYYLLAQSGGAPVAASQNQNNANSSTNNFGQNSQYGELVNSSGRNPNFDLDFYIDDLEIRTRYPGAGTAAAHSIVELNFSITEPYGISLLGRLHKAIADSYTVDGIDTNGNYNYARALYAMVIKFWGYTSTGTLERVVSSRGVPVEKLIPFNIVDLRFTQSSRFIEYKIAGRSPASYANFGSERGIALDRYNLTGASVRDVLVGKGQLPSTRTTQTANPVTSRSAETPPI